MFDFPNSPTNGTQATGSGGQVYTFDGAKWVATATAAGVTSWNTRTGAVTMSSGDVTTALTYTPYNATNPSGYQTAAQVTTALAPYAPLAAPVFTGDARAVTATAGDNDTSIATTAFVQTALTNGVPNANVVDNNGFAVNQRSYTSGTALASGAFAHDRWKGGASGCTYTFTQSGGPATTITITAGSLQQVVEGAALSTGSYTLSWTGTAQGRVGAGSYAASPVAVAATVGTNLTIEFNAGTVGQVKLEAGTVRTAWIPGGTPQQILAECQRFYQVGYFKRFLYHTAGNLSVDLVVLPVTMRAVPSVAISGTPSIGNGSSLQVLQYTVQEVQVQFTVTASGAASIEGVFTASADA